MLNSEMITIVMPALFAGIMIALTHAPLGIEVLKRGIIFIDLAIAQIAGFGLVLANALYEGSMVIMQVFALAFALAGAFFFRVVERRSPAKQEAVIGCSFIVAACASILVLSGNPHGAEEIQHLLSGQILFVTWDDIFKHFPVYLLILALWLFAPKVRNGVWFYILFALAITSSVQLAGVYVVFASLILPALATAAISKAWLHGITSVTAGIIISVITDLPTGPVIVCSYVALTILVTVLRASIKKNIYK